jgi:hypothetical protein
MINFGEKVKEYRGAQQTKYFNDYWGSSVNAYGNYDGRILWDGSTGDAVYSQPTQALPNLAAMWSQYAKGAKSRGIKPDFIQFKSYYDTLKAKRKSDFIGQLKGAELRGIPVDKIQDMLRKNPGLTDDLVKAINETGDENLKAELGAFVPQQEKTLEQVMNESSGMMGAALMAGGAGAAYAFGKDQTAIKESKKLLADAKSKYSKGVADMDAEAKQWKKDNPRPKKPTGKEPQEKRFKTKANYNKAKAKYDAEQLKYKNDIKQWNEDKKSMADSHRKQRSQLSIEKRGAKIETMKADRTRLGSFMRGKFGKTPSLAGGIGMTAAWFGAPMATSSIAKAMGFDEATQQSVANFTNHAMATGYTLKQVGPAVNNALKVKRAGGSKRQMWRAFKKTPKSKLGLTLLAASYILPSFFGGEEEDQTVYQVSTTGGGTQPSGGTKPVRDSYSPFQ